ncbi:hypothetical protein X474_26165 [Dethiosulfatarculus sandiegensis]|uniref:Uncharacterized protein n=1 Tax=Dethiosulfatarculus sandiegensis TaxID=1429043 RepID=A0A0D2HKT6_9BACT|nr:hypothetical protein X474_26165 [Dethiosulfatarculus sandiegensis]
MHLVNTVRSQIKDFDWSVCAARRFFSSPFFFRLILELFSFFPLFGLQFFFLYGFRVNRLTML